jgi:hypothetical protein
MLSGCRVTAVEKIGDRVLILPHLHSTLHTLLYIVYLKVFPSVAW